VLSDAKNAQARVNTKYGFAETGKATVEIARKAKIAMLRRRETAMRLG
jgi:hypothetical protein